MSIESRPDYQAGLIQLKADGLEHLSPERRAIAERARHLVKCLILGTAAHFIVARPGFESEETDG